MTLLVKLYWLMNMNYAQENVYWHIIGTVGQRTLVPFIFVDKKKVKNNPIWLHNVLIQANRYLQDLKVTQPLTGNSIASSVVKGATQNTGALGQW